MAIVRCATSEPLASTQLPALPSVGILTLDHLTSSGAATAGVRGEIEPSRHSSKNNLTVNLIVAIWRILFLLYGESQQADSKPR